MRSFAESFFAHFGAKIEPRADELIVDLPPELVDVFGKPRLYLVFPRAEGESHDLSPSEDLVVYGSRTFEQMLALLQDRGQATTFQFPTRFVEDNKNQGWPIPLSNCRLEARETLATTVDRYYIFNFRAVYISDEKQEEFITVALDEMGRSVPDKIDMLTNSGEPLLPPEQAAQIEPNTLNEMLDLATAVAYGQVDKRSADLEEMTKSRLEKVLLRLTTYYRRLLDESRTDDPAQNDIIERDLQRDLSRKIADELERHQLRVTLSPISYAICFVPFTEHRLHLATRRRQRLIDLHQNLYTGRIDHYKPVSTETVEEQPFDCHHCREPLDQLAICDRGHEVHPHCFDTCHRCDKDVCFACGIRSCLICENLVCVDCVETCAHCDRWLCAEHIDQCAICGLAYCTDHSFRCRWCNQLYCRDCQLAGVCETCRSAWSGSLQAEGLPVPAIAGQKTERYQWRQSQNEAYRIYIGQHRLWGKLIIVTNTAGEVKRWKKVGLLAWLFRKRSS